MGIKTLYVLIHLLLIHKLLLHHHYLILLLLAIGVNNSINVLKLLDNTVLFIILLLDGLLLLSLVAVVFVVVRITWILGKEFWSVIDFFQADGAVVTWMLGGTNEFVDHWGMLLLRRAGNSCGHFLVQEIMSRGKTWSGYIQ